MNASDRSRSLYGHPFSNGDTVTFSGGTSVGGSLNGNFTVKQQRVPYDNLNVPGQRARAVVDQLR